MFIEDLVLDPETCQETLPPSPQEEVDEVTPWHPVVSSGLEGCLVTAGVDMAAQSGSQQQGQGSVDFQKYVLCLLSLWTSFPESGLKSSLLMR